MDATTIDLPDTEVNQTEYPQSDGQKPGIGSPIIRLVVLFCLATGAVLRKRNIDVVFHKHQNRRTDFRKATRLGRNDHIITWQTHDRQDLMSVE